MGLSEPRFFRSPAHFRRWLEPNHGRFRELWVGHFKKDAGRPCMSWPESVDEALCFGWIDGIRKSVDAVSYTIRFTPRRRNSVWSAVNIRNVQRLIAEERMQTAGLKAFQARREHRSEIYSYEQRPAHLPKAFAAQMRRKTRAWQFFQAQPPGYRQKMIWWITSAKQEITRQKRLAKLIKVSATGRRMD